MASNSSASCKLTFPECPLLALAEIAPLRERSSLENHHLAHCLPVDAARQGEGAVDRRLPPRWRNADFVNVTKSGGKPFRWRGLYTGAGFDPPLTDQIDEKPWRKLPIAHRFL